MELFEAQFALVHEYLASQKSRDNVKTIRPSTADWPSGLGRNLILSQDAAVELGNPKEVSASFLLWSEQAEDIQNGRLRLIGPDLPESAGRSLPFGKVVLIHGYGFTAENTYPRYREMEGLRYEMDLKGYMMRAVSQYQREWSRVSREALNQGFSFGVLGSAVLKSFQRLEYVAAVEVLFVTSASEQVAALKSIGDQAGRIIGAMNKMSVEMSFDCDSCEYGDVCGDVADLRSMRKTMRTAEVEHG